MLNPAQHVTNGFQDVSDKLRKRLKSISRNPSEGVKK
jgi:hypothetical protein